MSRASFFAKIDNPVEYFSCLFVVLLNIAILVFAAISSCSSLSLLQLMACYVLMPVCVLVPLLLPKRRIFRIDMGWKFEVFISLLFSGSALGSILQQDWSQYRFFSTVSAGLYLLYVFSADMLLRLRKLKPDANLRVEVAAK